MTRIRFGWIPSFAGLLLAAALPAQQAETEFAWPQWRGPDRDGVSKEPWKGGTKLEKAWFTNVGIGYSTVSVAGDRLYTMGHDEEEQKDTIFCLDVATGRDVWTYSFPARTMARAHGGGTLSTPSIDGPRLFASNREGNFFCFDRDRGKLRWKKNLTEEFGLKIPRWGFAASPLVLEDRIVMNVGRVLAFDREGKVLWKTEEDYGDCYSTPADFEHDGRRLLAVFNARGLVVLDVESGEEVAFHPWKTAYDVNAATPVVIGDRIFISSGYNHGCAMLRLTGEGLELLWESRVMRNHMAGCVLYDGALFGFDESTFKCLGLDGEVRWSKRGFGKSAFTIAGGKLLILSRNGDLVVAPASTEGFEEEARARVLFGGVKWTTPVYCNGRVYCRSSLGDLVCVVPG